MAPHGGDDRLGSTAGSDGVRREVAIRTFNDWGDPPPGFCEIDMVIRRQRRTSAHWRMRSCRRRSSSGCVGRIARSIQVALLAEIRSCQEELGQRIDARGIKSARRRPVESLPAPTEVGAFVRTLGTAPLDSESYAVAVAAAEPRATHRKPKRRYKTRMRMPSKLDPHLAKIEGWFTDDPAITALAIVRGLAEIDPAAFGDSQHSIVQRLLRAMPTPCSHP